MSHAAESTHWYTRNGEPAYTVKAKAGHDRPTTLADARKLALVPSVTTIIRCADRPGLTNWMVDQGIMAALTLPRNDGEPEADWIRRVKQDSKEQARKAAERGTEIHAAIQGAFEGETALTENTPYIEGVFKAINDWHMDWAWEAETAFSHTLGFGGKVDLRHHAAAFVADFKTKEFCPDDKLQTWDEHAMQLAAYRVGLGMEKARCAICYVSVNNPGLAKVIEIDEDDLQRGWECFKALLAFWKAKNRFDPSYQEKAAA